MSDWKYLDPIRNSEENPYIDEYEERKIRPRYTNKVGKMCLGCMSFDNEDFECKASRYCTANDNESEEQKSC